MTIDIMIDLETLGTKAGCALLSIGACSFDGKETFYRTIEPDSNNRFGLSRDADALAWWNKQFQSVREEAFSGTTSVNIALLEFGDWFRKLERTNGSAYIWGNGADFDLPILQAAYVACDIAVPWKPFNGRCYRTLKNLYKDIKMAKMGVLDKHNALSDAVAQAAHASAILRKHFSPV